MARFHDADSARQAEEDFIQQFKQKEIPDDIPLVNISLSEPVWICRLLTEAGLVSSNGEARRLIKQGAVRLSGERVNDADQEIAPEGEVVLQAGKRRFARVVFN